MSSHRSDTDLDAELARAGAEWRAQQPIPSEVIPDAARPSAVAFVVTAFCAVAMLAIVAVVNFRGPVVGEAGTSFGPSQTGNGPSIIDGDVVSASGRVVLLEQGGMPSLCRFGPLLMPNVPDRVEPCPGTKVGLAKIAVADLPGWHQIGSGGRSSNVRVTGVWRTGVIDVQRVVIADPGPTLPTISSGVPCEAPQQGWPGNGNTAAMEAATARLENVVTADPDTYVGSWWADGSPGAIVVGAVRNVATVRAEIVPIYPFNLCVLEMSRSRTDLQKIASEVAHTSQTFETTIWPPSDKVLVRVIALDENTLKSLAPYGDALEFQPLVTRS